MTAPVTIKRQEEVRRFLSSVPEECYSEEDFAQVAVTSTEVAAFLDHLYQNCNTDVPKLDIKLLREQVTWARKSHTVKEDFANMGWKQEVWLETEMLGTPTEVINDEGEHLGFVADNYCNTAGCIAGGIAMQLGEPVWEKISEGRYGAAWMQTGETIEAFAKQKLGLRNAEARLLFDEHAPIDYIEAVAEGICISRGLEY